MPERQRRLLAATQGQPPTDACPPRSLVTALSCGVKHPLRWLRMSERRDGRPNPKGRRRRARQESTASSSNRGPESEPTRTAHYQRADADMYLVGGPPSTGLSGSGIATLFLLLLIGVIVVGLLLGWPQIIAGWWRSAG